VAQVVKSTLGCRKDDGYLRPANCIEEGVTHAWGMQARVDCTLGPPRGWSVVQSEITSWNIQEGKMLRHIAKMSLVTTLAFVFFTATVTVTAWAQNGRLRIDSGHSTASLSLLSSSNGMSWNIGVAKVSGTVKISDNPSEDVFDLNIYPARQGSRLLDPDGGFRGNSFANLSRYTVMSFHSSGVTRNRDGKLAVRGKLSVTYVQRQANIAWNDSYSGPDYSEPEAQSTTHEVTFVLEAQNRATDTMRNHGTEEMSGLATINLHDFPRLRATWLDSVWPIVVEDEHCVIPDVRGTTRDYSGAVCTGTPIEVKTLSRPSERFDIDYPGPDVVTAPASDGATILIDLRLEGRS